MRAVIPETKHQPDNEAFRKGIGKSSIWKDIKKNKYLYIIFLPALLHMILFKYLPMYGILIAFKDFNPFAGFDGSPWVGFKYFEQFFSSIYFPRLLRNTFMINIYDLIICFPAPILLALMLNEVRAKIFKRTIQTISYLPYFISTVVIVSMLMGFLNPSTGLFNNILTSLGLEKIRFLEEPKYFWGIFTGMNLWKNVGYGSIIYLSAITAVDMELYEAAYLDGAGRLRQTWHVTLPAILPTIVIMLLVRIGHLLEVGHEAIILMYNSSIYETADVFSSYVYRRGIQDLDMSFAAAVGLFQSLVGLVLVIISNKLSRKFSEASLW